MKCAACQREGAEHRCGGACCQRAEGAAHYCNERCQRDHWRAGHHEECTNAAVPQSAETTIGADASSKVQAERQKSLLESLEQVEYLVYDVRARYATRDWFGSNQRRVLNVTTRVVTEQGFRPVFFNADGTVKDETQLKCQRVRCPAELTRVRGAPALWCWACTESLALPPVGQRGPSVSTQVFETLLAEPEPIEPAPRPDIPILPGIVIRPGGARRPESPRPRPRPTPRPRRELPILPGIVVQVSHDEDADEDDALGIDE